MATTKLELQALRRDHEAARLTRQLAPTAPATPPAVPPPAPPPLHEQVTLLGASADPRDRLAARLAILRDPRGYAQSVASASAPPPAPAPQTAAGGAMGAPPAPTPPQAPPAASAVPLAPAPPAVDLHDEVTRLGSSSDPRDRMRARLLVLQNPQKYAAGKAAR